MSNETNEAEPSGASAGSRGADITKMLRKWSCAATMPACEIMIEAASEIELLRLTDEEREAIEFKAAHCVTVADQMHQRCAVTLLALLERMK